MELRIIDHYLANSDEKLLEVVTRLEKLYRKKLKVKINTAREQKERKLMN